MRDRIILFMFWASVPTWSADVINEQWSKNLGHESSIPPLVQHLLEGVEDNGITSNMCQSNDESYCAEVKTFFKKAFTANKNLIVFQAETIDDGTTNNRSLAVSLFTRDSLGIGEYIILGLVEGEKGPRINEQVLSEGVKKHLMKSVLEVLDDVTLSKVEQESLRISAKMINDAIANGAPENKLFALREETNFWHKGVVVTNWEEWVDHFDAEIYGKPKQFILKKDDSYDFSEKIAALRSYYQALYYADGQVLLVNADKEGRVFLDQTFGISKYKKEGTKIDTFMFPPFTDHVSVLMEARLQLGKNEELVLFLSRLQNSIKPKEFNVEFNVAVFRYDGNKYAYSTLADESVFGEPLRYAKFNPEIQKYSQFVESCKKASLPHHFCEIP